jgi:hypothetical protein
MKKINLPKIDVVNIFYTITDFKIILLLIAFLLLLDTYLLNIFNVGFVDINISDLFKINIIKHILLFLLLFGITYHVISSLLFVLLREILSIFYFGQKNKNHIYYITLREQAVNTKNNFLMEYVKNEIKSIFKTKNTYKVIYTLFISIILNIFETDSSLKKIIQIVINIKKNTFRFFLILIFIMTILFIGYIIYISLKYNEEYIYYKDDI